MTNLVQVLADKSFAIQDRLNAAIRQAQAELRQLDPNNRLLGYMVFGEGPFPEKTEKYHDAYRDQGVKDSGFVFIGEEYWTDRLYLSELRKEKERLAKTH